MLLALTVITWLSASTQHPVWKMFSMDQKSLLHCSLLKPGWWVRFFICRVTHLPHGSQKHIFSCRVFDGSSSADDSIGKSDSFEDRSVIGFQLGGSQINLWSLHSKGTTSRWMSSPSTLSDIWSSCWKLSKKTKGLLQFQTLPIIFSSEFFYR